MTLHEEPMQWDGRAPVSFADADTETEIEGCDGLIIKLQWTISETWDRGMWQSSRSHLVSRTATLLGCTIGDLRLSAADTALAVDAVTIEWARGLVEAGE